MSFTKHDIYPMDVFLKNKYYIPNYQREYSWENDQLDDFWRDLNAALITQDDVDHFFGQIVVHSDIANKKKYIIDGQQRTTTSIIFLRVLQMYFHKLYQDSGNTLEDANFNDVLITKQYIGNKTNPHLHLGSDVDQQFFIDIILAGKGINNPPSLGIHDKKSHKNLLNAFRFFYGMIDESIKDEVTNEGKCEIITEYYDTFVNKFKVLYVEATELNEAFVIFETLNARGKELEAADLLKTYIFSITKPNEINTAQTRWNNMNNTLDGADLTKYIRCYWNATQGFVREKELYRRISQKIKNPVQSRSLLECLEKYSQQYHDLTFPDDGAYLTNTELIECIKNLKTIGASSYYPLVVSMFARQTPFSEKEVAEVLKQVEILYFRNNTICKNTANATEVFFAKLAIDVYTENLDSVDEICASIKKQIVSDDIFAEAFYTWNSKSKNTIRYILYKIHEYLCDNVTTINSNNQIVHIEHIMPKNNSKWKVDKDVHDEYLWRLGNLALMDGKSNTKASNEVFSTKKSMYKNSAIRPNPEVAIEIEWGKNEIEKRQRRLATYALKIWELKK